MKRFTMVALATMVAVPMVAPQAAQAQSNYDQNHTYRGNDGHYRQDCKRSSGTTGLVAGGVVGGVAGHALGGGTLGTLAGAGGGALLGRHLDKKHDEAQNRKNGC